MVSLTKLLTVLPNNVNSEAFELALKERKIWLSDELLSGPLTDFRGSECAYICSKSCTHLYDNIENLLRLGVKNFSVFITTMNKTSLTKVIQSTVSIMIRTSKEIRITFWIEIFVPEIEAILEDCCRNKYKLNENQIIGFGFRIPGVLFKKISQKQDWILISNDNILHHLHGAEFQNEYIRLSASNTKGMNAEKLLHLILSTATCSAFNIYVFNRNMLYANVDRTNGDVVFPNHMGELPLCCNDVVISFNAMINLDNCLLSDIEKHSSNCYSIMNDVIHTLSVNVDYPCTIIASVGVHGYREHLGRKVEHWDLVKLSLGVQKHSLKIFPFTGKEASLMYNVSQGIWNNYKLPVANNEHIIPKAYLEFAKLNKSQLNESSIAELMNDIIVNIHEESIVPPLLQQNSDQRLISLLFSSPVAMPLIVTRQDMALIKNKKRFVNMLRRMLIENFLNSSIVLLPPLKTCMTRKDAEKTRHNYDSFANGFKCGYKLFNNFLFKKNKSFPLKIIELLLTKH